MAKTITLEIPDDIAERFEAMPQEQRNNFAVAALRRAWTEELPNPIGKILVGRGKYPFLSSEAFLESRYADKEKEL